MAVKGRAQDGGDSASTLSPAQLRRADDLVRRGADRMRSEPAAGWFDVVERVTDAVRSAGRRGLAFDAAWPDAAHAHAAPLTDRLRISDLVVVDALRRSLTDLPRCQPSAVDLLIAEESTEHSSPATSGAPLARHCRGARVSLVAAFDVDLHAVAAQARRLTLDTLSDVLGPPVDGLARDAVVDVEIVDVTPLDPRR